MFQAPDDAAGAHGDPAAGREEGWAGGQEEAQREAARAPATQQVEGDSSGAGSLVLLKVASEFHPKVRNHGEGPF